MGISQPAIGHLSCLCRYKIADCIADYKRQVDFWSQLQLQSCVFRPTSSFGEQCVQSAQPNNGQQSLDRTTHSGGDPIADATLGTECETIINLQNNGQETFLLQLFVTYGNRLANQIWAPAVPGAEQLLAESSNEQRSKFIKDKYTRGRYRRVHALVSSQSAMDQVCRRIMGACLAPIRKMWRQNCSVISLFNCHPARDGFSRLASTSRLLIPTLWLCDVDQIFQDYT